MTLPTTFGEFRVAADPELRFAPSGAAVCSLLLVGDSKKKVNDEWVDDKVLWLPATAFQRLAENVAESFVKGNLVNVVGKIYTDEWEDKDGTKRSRVKMNLDSISHSTRWDASTTIKGDRVQGGAPKAQPAGENPWVTPDQDAEAPF